MLKKSLSLLLAGILAAGLLAACDSPPKSEQLSSAPSVSVAQGASDTSLPAQEGTVLFTDSLGREVEIPAHPERLAPSGPLAQIFLYTLAPDLIVGWSSHFSDAQKEFIDEKYWSLPTYGQLYGKNANLSLEELLAVKPDLIIDVGEVKKNMAEDIDAVQQQTGVPIIFIEASLQTLPKAYETTGEILGMQAEAKKLSSYIQETLTQAEDAVAALADQDKKTVYYGLGQAGLEPNAQGSPHAQVIEVVGGVNVAQLDANANAVSMEEILVWNPDVVLMDPNGPYEEVKASAEWNTLPAVQQGRLYQVPIGPYNWLGRPPSVNQVLGIKWLGNLLYPELYDLDILQETIEFYELFYHVKITEEQAGQLIQNSRSAA